MSGTIPIENEALTGSLQQDIRTLKGILDRSADIQFRYLEIGARLHGVLVFVNGLTNQDLINAHVVKPLIEMSSGQPDSPPEELAAFLKNRVLSVGQITTPQQVYELVDDILSGSTVLLVDGMKQALSISAVQWDKRSVEEPATEAVIRGARDGFTESLTTNTVLIRKRLQTSQLKMESMKIGRLSRTQVILAYLDGIADPAVIEEIRSRLKRIDIDGILESGYIEELIEDNHRSIFPQILNTERPDRVAACLLEGKAALLINNTPFALVMPMTFLGFLQATEDYYQRYLFSTCLRWLRYFLAFCALTLPSIYIALTTFHQEMIPLSLFLSIASARDTVPFPAVVEALLMEVTFEGLREAGVRLPKTVGQAVSIVGALVIGQAAVQAGIVGAPLVIIVSFTGISSFVLPSYNQAISIRLLRFPLMFLASTLGLYGILLGLLAILIHLARLRSFGVPFMAPVAPVHLSALKDTLVRAPWSSMKTRPPETAKRNLTRMRNSDKRR
ncbi:MAG: spore germination protein [Paenibacillaceae bacterium]|uniref:Spore germination protein n=1 Tax=Paenibacillus mellifer TaxID=2937794 RepID=A0A9X2BPI3_9BACL|nr:spore germination protein [Paenibacillus mellifer]MBW4841658.1 spore germination protein [Paenibacillaceae bacterium]MCK8487218.1 spore germination protein [Paenibacillus mellifer]